MPKLNLKTKTARRKATNCLVADIQGYWKMDRDERLEALRERLPGTYASLDADVPDEEILRYLVMDAIYKNLDED